MKKLKWLKGLALSSFVGMTAISLVACGNDTGATHALTNAPTDYLKDNNSPLNGTFNNSPTSTYGQTRLYGLTTYQTTGQFERNDKGEFIETTNDTLILEAASAVIAFKDENVMKDVDNKLGNNLITENKISQKQILDKLADIKDGVEKSATDTEQTQQSEESSTDASQQSEDVTTSDKWSDGVDFWVFLRDKGGIQFQGGLSNPNPESNISSYYEKAVSNATVYQFIIDTDNQWVDGNGVEKQPVSSKDFERGLETYALASAIGYTRNSYFLDLVGLGENNLNKTVSYENQEKYVSPSDPNYDVENYANKNDAIYTLYIDEAYPYTLDLISKEYFGPLPHTNQKVKNISLKSGKIVLNSDGKIDRTATKFNEIFGSGSLGKFTEDTWYAGAYYISAFTSSQIIFNINNTYMETAGKDLLSYENGKPMKYGGLQNTDSRMGKIVINYGSGTPDTYVENFKAGQIDYLASVPETKKSEVAGLGSSVKPIKIVQTTQSNYIAYTPNPYVVNVDEKTNQASINANANIDENMANFIYQWDSKEAMIIRAGIAGLVNYYSLARMVYSDSKDFQLSATPYGVFKDYYENVVNGNIYGALPRPYSDYTAVSVDTLDKEFKIPYYSYTTDEVTIEEVVVNKQTFKDAINSFNKSNSKPLNFMIKFGEGSFSVNYSNYLQKLQSTIKDLSDGLIVVDLNLRENPNPTANEWFNSQSSPLGFSYWSPDYNGVGTWIEADNTLENVKVNSTTYEGVPGTNAHNSFHTFLASMVYAVKLMGYTWNDTNKKYEEPSSPSTTGDPYAKDQKIQQAFSDKTLQAFGIQTSDESFKSKNTPGERYGVIAIELLNLLIEKGVFDQTKLTKYINDPAHLNYLNNKPTNVQDLYIGGDVIKEGQSANFSKYLGIFAGQSTAKALYENTVLDSDYSFIPRPEAGLKETLISLVNPKYVARSGTQSINYRDFGIKNN